MKNILMLGVATLALAACGQVKPGYVGIKVNQYGSGAGVDATPVGVGTYFTPPGTNIFDYPVFTRIYTFTASQEEQNNQNEEFVFQDKSGLTVSTDAAVSYSVNPSLAPALYSKFRADEEQLMEGQVKNFIRNSFVTHASQMNVQDIYGPQKALLIAQVWKDTAQHFAPYGLNIEGISYAGPIRIPDSVRGQINQRIANENAALAAQANVATATANAQAKVEAAKGEAQSNQLIAESLRTNPEIVKLRAIEKWNGSMPAYYGGGGGLPFIGDTRGVAEEK